MRNYEKHSFKVSKREFDVDTEKLKGLLIEHKKQAKLTNEQIAEMLLLPKTKVEHWFRKDKYFSIPVKEYWMQLKEILQIETEEFDESIMSFVEEDGKFDMNNRVYPADGICPTISANQDIKIKI